jgi:hypothetical protein
MEVTQVNPTITAPNQGALRTVTLGYILDHLVQAPAGSPLVDLGAGHCLFSRVAAKRGFTVTAVDGRDERKPADLGGISFVKSDVRAFDISGFRVILIVGLLYHLTLDDQIDLLSRCPDSAEVVVDTQVHIPDLVVSEGSAERGRFAEQLVRDRDYAGVVFPEGNNTMASIGNTSSWWHTEESLLTLFRNSRFSQVVEVGAPYVSKYGARRWYVARRDNHS